VRKLLPIAAALAVAVQARAACEPTKMVRVVYQDTSPGIDPQSPDAQPETLYRLGPRYARVEGAPDLQHGVRPLMVVNEPDIWMVNLVTNHGRHLIDAGSDAGFQAPVVGEPEIPRAIAEIEFGCEMEFVKTAGKPKAVELEGQRVNQYERRIDAYRLVLSVSQKKNVPVAFTLYEGETVVFAIRYLQYETGLAPKMELFQQPAGVTYEEEQSPS